MARKIQVTPRELELTAKKIDTLAEDYKTQYDLLYKETSKMATAWSGKDNVAFTTQIEGFKDDFQKMHNLMKAYSQFLVKSAKLYQQTQDAIVSGAKKLKN